MFSLLVLLLFYFTVIEIDVEFDVGMTDKFKIKTIIDAERREETTIPMSFPSPTNAPTTPSHNTSPTQNRHHHNQRPRNVTTELTSSNGSKA